MILSARQEKAVYSLSRWTDLPAGKWDWFKTQLKQGWMFAIDQRTSVPARWSLHPDETLGLAFWTKNPHNLVKDRALLRPYLTQIHVTVTGWEEVEKRAPRLVEAVELLKRSVGTFGPDVVTWRFSPIPAVPGVVGRFERIVREAAREGLSKVLVSFLQENDRVPELRSTDEQLEILRQLTFVGEACGVSVQLCNEYRALVEGVKGLSTGLCLSPAEFGLETSDGCGCAFTVDPFSINESCVYGCTFCYASDKLLSLKRRNTSL